MDRFYYWWKISFLKNEKESLVKDGLIEYALMFLIKFLYLTPFIQCRDQLLVAAFITNPVLVLLWNTLFFSFKQILSVFDFARKKNLCMLSYRSLLLS